MAKIEISEDLTHEFKSDLRKLSDSEIIDAVVAFANTDGGELYIGIEDDGEITGLHEAHKDITKLSAFITNKTVPPVSVRTELLELSLPVVKIEVSKSTAVIASSNGKIQRRRIKADGSPENVPMYPYEIATRLSSLGIFDYTSQPVPDSSYDDIDPVERERLRNIIRTYRGEPTLLDLNDEELDKALRLVAVQNGQLVPTFCGLLLVGRKDKIYQHIPTAESSIQVFSGTDLRVNESFHLPLLAAFERISEYFFAQNHEEELEIGMFRMSIPDYDKRAFREALVNAFSHRDYSILGCVRVSIADDGLTITNPGGFIEGISADNLIEAEPRSRNPALSDALKRIGLAERTGRGIDRIYEGSLLYGRILPDYSRSNSVTVNLYIPKSVTDKEFVRMISLEHQRLGHPLPLYSLLVLNQLKQLKKASLGTITEAVHSDETRIRVTLEALTESGIVEAGGTGRGRYYMLGASYYRSSNDAASYTRQKYIDPIRFEKLILSLAESKGFVKRADVIELLHVTPPQAYRLLNRLARNEKLKRVGNGMNSRYIIPDENNA